MKKDKRNKAGKKKQPKKAERVIKKYKVFIPRFQDSTGDG